MDATTASLVGPPSSLADIFSINCIIKKKNERLKLNRLKTPWCLHNSQNLLNLTFALCTKIILKDQHAIYKRNGYLDS